MVQPKVDFSSPDTSHIVAAKITTGRGVETKKLV